MSITKNTDILIIATAGISTTIIYNTLANSNLTTELLLENKISKTTIIKNRIRRIGFFRTINQLLFIATIPKLLKLVSKERESIIINKYGLQLSAPPIINTNSIDSVNSDETIKIINQIQPKLIIVNGTRIINKKIIEQITVPIINIHTGITPNYRGVHGGYWALYNNDPENFGTTIHYLDAGIDTGKVIKQYRIIPDKKDNFSTYPFLQYAILTNELPAILESIINKTVTSQPNNTSTSNLYYHPTLTQYLYAFFFKGIK